MLKTQLDLGRVLQAYSAAAVKVGGVCRRIYWVTWCSKARRLGSERFLIIFLFLSFLATLYLFLKISTNPTRILQLPFFFFSPAHTLNACIEKLGLFHTLNKLLNERDESNI